MLFFRGAPKPGPALRFGRKGGGLGVERFHRGFGGLALRFGGSDLGGIFGSSGLQAFEM